MTMYKSDINNKVANIKLNLWTIFIFGNSHLFTLKHPYNNTNADFKLSNTIENLLSNMFFFAGPKS